MENNGCHEPASSGTGPRAQRWDPSAFRLSKPMLSLVALSNPGLLLAPGQPGGPTLQQTPLPGTCPPQGGQHGSGIEVPHHGGDFPLCHPISRLLPGSSSTPTRSLCHPHLARVIPARKTNEALKGVAGPCCRQPRGLAGSRTAFEMPHGPSSLLSYLGRADIRSCTQDARGCSFQGTFMAWGYFICVPSSHVPGLVPLLSPAAGRAGEHAAGLRGLRARRGALPAEALAALANIPVPLAEGI